MQSIGKRLVTALVVFGLFGVAPLAAVPQKCYWVCNWDTDCYQQCDWDGEPATCADYGVCACTVNQVTILDEGQFCHEHSDGWSAEGYQLARISFVANCRPEFDSCDTFGVAPYNVYGSEEECCAAEGCWGSGGC